MLQPFSTTYVHIFTTMKRHGMRLNLIAKPIANSQLPSNIKCMPMYCNVESDSNRTSVWLRNVSGKKIPIPAKAVICQVQLANMVPKLYSPVRQMSTEASQEEDGSLCRSTDVFSKTDLDLGKCNILKCDIKLTDCNTSFF